MKERGLLRIPSPNLKQAGLRHRGESLSAVMIADVGLAGLLDLLMDLPDDATVADMRGELLRRAAKAMLVGKG